MHARPTLNLSIYLSIIVVLGLFIWFFFSILPPFLFGGFWAYCYAPLVDKIKQKLPIPAYAIALFFMLLTYALLFFSMITLVPLVRKISHFVYLYFPEFQSIVWEAFLFVQKKFLVSFDIRMQETLYTILKQISGSIGTVLVYFLHNSWSVAQIVITLLISPIITFHLIKDGQNIKARIIALIPQTYHEKFFHTVHELDQALAGYFRGQLAVSSALVLYYTCALCLCEFPHAFAWAVFTALLMCIPYVGFAISLIAALMSSFWHFQDIHALFLMTGIYLAGQALESFVLTPTLIGRRTGLHPLWVLFLVFAGGMIKGMTGVLLALPFGTLIAAFWRSFRSEYLENSKFFSKKEKEVFPLSAQPYINEKEEK